MGDNYRVIMLVKSPKRGMVKSRLAASVGEDIALHLYKCFVDDLLRMFMGRGYHLTIFFHPPESRQKIIHWLGNEHTLFPQAGDNLGERMKNAFNTVFSQGISLAILAGSDSPDLPSLIIDEALASLRDNDAVVGPSSDGGYYLIGFRADAFLPQAFDGIAWSTSEVFMQTMDVLMKGGRRVHILPVWRDVDTFDDLKALFTDSHKRSFVESSTTKYIQSNIWDLFEASRE